MKKTVIAAIIIAAPALLSAQSAIDAFRLSQSDIRGTARFMSMGGAFTALGGDLSTLTQNPAGIGVYRRSEIGVTLDISPTYASAQSGRYVEKVSSTPVSCNNFGYIGTARLNGAMETFSWGAAYNRVASLNRRFRAYGLPTGTSLSNYIADYSTAYGYRESELDFGKDYNPYLQGDADWLSILAYNSFLINPTADGGYAGLYQNGSYGDFLADVRETGYVDEYTIDFGGNVKDRIMWGIGIGITDVQLNRSVSYSESISDAYIPTSSGAMSTGDAEFYLQNHQNISGTGFNLKLGLIFKPINELRIGVAFHTPTWGTFSNSSYGDVSYSYYNYASDAGRDNPIEGYEYTDDSYYNFRLNTPWKFMAGAAVVLGSTAIVSADYEYQAYDKMRVSYQQFGNYVSDEFVNADVEEYYRGVNIFRVGAEFRVTPSFSLRAGYNYTSAASSKYMYDGGEVLTSGTDPSFLVAREQNAFSAGLGYRYKAFYIDAAYVYRNRKSTYKPYTDYGQVHTPQASLTENINSLVFSVGFKF